MSPRRGAPLDAELEEDLEEGAAEDAEGWEAAASGRGRSSRAPAGEWRVREHHASLALGLLAMAPLLAAYECSLGHVDPALRNASELLVFRSLGPTGGSAFPRVLLLGAALALAAGLCFRRRVPLLPGMFRVFLEGLAAAVLLGPALALTTRLVEVPLGDLVAGPVPGAAPPPLARAAQLLGGAAYEELVFRVGAYSLLFLATSRLAGFFGAGDPLRRWLAEGVGLFGSALLFAGFHLARWTAWLGPGGEPFSAPIFAWRFLAGVLLALLFRWRGPGVAAWSHGLFNLALFLGAGPEALL